MIIFIVSSITLLIFKLFYQGLFLRGTVVPYKITSLKDLMFSTLKKK